MKNRLPPLNALRVFEVAARKLSFSQAAKELFVTQGAVSKQIKILEEYLDTALFDRTNGGLELTLAGKQYLPNIMTALDQIQSSSTYLQHSFEKIERYTIDVTPSFSSLWLIPRLSHMKECFPNLHLDISAGDGRYQFHQFSADIVIRCLPLSIGDENAKLLKQENLVALVHKDLLSSNPINKKSDLLKHPLLPHTTRPQLWTQFLNTTGVIDSNPELISHFSHGFEHFYMSLEGARHKQGVVLVPDFLAENYLKEGHLVNPLGLSYKSGYGFYFLAPPYRQSNTIVTSLFEWFYNGLNN